MIISRKSARPPQLIHPEGEMIQEILGTHTGKVQSHSLARVTLPPGKASVPHYHKVSDESYLILSGTATMIIDKIPFILTAGDANLIERGEVHKISNQSLEDLIFLAVCIPSWQDNDHFQTKEMKTQ